MDGKACIPLGPRNALHGRPVRLSPGSPPPHGQREHWEHSRPPGHELFPPMEAETCETSAGRTPGTWPASKARAHQPRMPPPAAVGVHILDDPAEAQERLRRL